MTFWQNEEVSEQNLIKIVAQMISHQIHKATNIITYDLLLLTISLKKEFGWHKLRVILKKYISKNVSIFLLWGKDH